MLKNDAADDNPINKPALFEFKTTVTSCMLNLTCLTKYIVEFFFVSTTAKMMNCVIGVKSTNISGVGVVFSKINES